MVEEPRCRLTKKHISAANQLSNKPTKATSTGLARSLKLMVRLGHTLNVTLAVGAAMLTVSSLDLAQFMESQAQTLFYVLRGPLTPTTAVTSMQSAWLA